MQTTINGFYEVEVIAEAKKYLYDVAVNCAKEISRMISRQGDKKKQKDSGDLIGIYELLDMEKCSMAIFFAADLNKVPTVKVKDADVCSLVVQKDKLKSLIGDTRVGNTL